MEFSVFDCIICCRDAIKESSRNRKVTCISCNYSVCSVCQKSYGKLDCMNCHVVFRNSHAIELLGVEFVTKTVKKNKLNELMIQQEEELKTIGPLVEWTQNMRIIQKNEKYGISVVMDAEQRKKPFRLNASSSFPCWVAECRGHVTMCQASENKGKCNVCAKYACLMCQEAYHPNTPCDANTLETLKEIKEIYGHVQNAKHIFIVHMDAITCIVQNATHILIMKMGRCCTIPPTTITGMH